MTDIYQDYDEILSEIDMSHDGLPWLILEGPSDEIFFKTIYTDNVKITSASGWENVVSIIDISQREFIDKNVFGVIDKDFREVLSIDKTSDGVLIPSEYIFETDNIDLENMLFHSEPTINRVLLNYVKESYRGSFGDIIRHIVQETTRLSKFRYFCLLNTLAISLSEIDHGKFIDEKLNFNPQKFINHVNGKNSGKENIGMSYWDESQLIELPDVISIPQRLCNGHDLLVILGISLRRLYGSNEKKLVDKLAVEKYFRMSYSQNDFEKTNLYSNLSDYLS